MDYFFKSFLSVSTIIARLLWNTTSDRTGRNSNEGREVRKQRATVVAVALIMLVVGAVATRFHYRYDFHYSNATPLNLVHHKLFENQIVRLDGYRYVACLFRNVTIEYDGGGPYGLEGNRFEGSVNFTSRNRSIDAAVGLLKGLGITNAPIFDSETGQEIRNIEAPRFAPHPGPEGPPKM